MHITDTLPNGYLQATLSENSLSDNIKRGDILVLMDTEREILFDMHGTNIGYLETCLGPVEVVEINETNIYLRGMWEGMETPIGAEVRRP